MNKYDIQLQYNLKASASTDWTSEEALAIHRFAKVQPNMLAERATIYLGSIPLEVFMLPNGRYVLSQTQVAEAVGKTEVSFRDFLQSNSPEALPYKGFRSAKLSITGNNVKINTIPINVTSAYWTKEAIVGNLAG